MYTVWCHDDVVRRCVAADFGFFERKDVVGLGIQGVEFGCLLCRTCGPGLQKSPKKKKKKKKKFAFKKLHPPIRGTQYRKGEWWALHATVKSANGSCVLGAPTNNVRTPKTPYTTMCKLQFTDLM